MDVTGFYDNHPISEAQITASLQARGLDLDDLKPADLYDFDQDHYGGLEAVDTLAERTGIAAGARVLDASGDAKVSHRCSSLLLGLQKCCIVM